MPHSPRDNPARSLRALKPARRSFARRPSWPSGRRFRALSLAGTTEHRDHGPVRQDGSTAASAIPSSKVLLVGTIAAWLLAITSCISRWKYVSADVDDAFQPRPIAAIVISSRSRPGATNVPLHQTGVIAFNSTRDLDQIEDALVFEDAPRKHDKKRIGVHRLRYGLEISSRELSSHLNQLW